MASLPRVRAGVQRRSRDGGGDDSAQDRAAAHRFEAAAGHFPTSFLEAAAMGRGKLVNALPRADDSSFIIHFGCPPGEAENYEQTDDVESQNPNHA